MKINATRVAQSKRQLQACVRVRCRDVVFKASVESCTLPYSNLESRYHDVQQRDLAVNHIESSSI